MEQQQKAAPLTEDGDIGFSRIAPHLPSGTLLGCASSVLGTSGVHFGNHKIVMFDVLLVGIAARLPYDFR